MPELERRPDWVDRLFEVIALHEARPFQRGVSDCWSMSMDAAKAITGTDPFRDKRRYMTERGALRMIRAYGVGNLGDGLATRLPETPVMTARRGDLATFDDKLAVGVVMGDMVLTKSPVVKGQNGIMALPLISAARAFRIG